MTNSAGERFREICITVGFSGYAPFAPGTWGSLAALAVFGVAWGCMRAANLASWMLDPALIAVGVAASSCLAVRWGDWALRRFNSNDPKQFVLDEFAGQWVALLFLTSLAGSGAALAALLAGQFLLFRLFDITKPPPARQLEALPSGWGVLCDDLMAGVYANIVGQLIWRWTPLSEILRRAATGD